MTENKDKKENFLKLQYRQFITGEKPYFVFWLSPIFIIILFLFPFIVTRSSCTPFFDYTETGQIGDTIGGLTGPIIAILVAILTFFAFWVQVKANISQKEQFKKQDIDLKIERFENKYFNLLNIYNNVVNQMAYTYTTSIQNDSGKSIGSNLNYLYGREAIKNHYDIFNKEILEIYLDKIKNEKDLKNKRNIFNIEYQKFLNNKQHLFGHYFRIIYQILKYLHTSKSIIEKQNDKNINEKFYSNILRASLSSQELSFIFFNGISDIALYGLDKLNYAKLIKEYSFFEHLSPVYGIDVNDVTEINSISSLLDLYDKKAYGENYNTIKIIFSVKNK